MPNGDVEFLDILNFRRKKGGTYGKHRGETNLIFLQLEVNTTSRTDVRNTEKIIVLLGYF